MSHYISAYASRQRSPNLYFSKQTVYKIISYRKCPINTTTAEIYSLIAGMSKAKNA